MHSWRHGGVAAVFALATMLVAGCAPAEPARIDADGQRTIEVQDAPPSNLEEEAEVLPEEAKPLSTEEDDRTDEASQKKKQSSESPAQELPAPPDAFTPECVDEFGQISAFAISELTGADLVQAARSQGYVYDGEQRGFVLDYRARLGVLDANFVPLTEDGIAALEKGGGTTPVVFVLQTTKYGTARELIDLMGRCTVDDRKTIGDHMTCAVLHGPSARQYLVSVSNPTDQSALTMHIISNEAVAAGMLDKMAGKTGPANSGPAGENPATDAPATDAPATGSPTGGNSASYGASIAEAWQNIAGVPIGEYLREHPDD